jgi:hypothetical protein
MNLDVMYMISPVHCWIETSSIPMVCSHQILVAPQPLTNLPIPGFSNPTPDSVTGSFVYALEELTSSPIFATDILVIDNYGRGKSTPAGETFKKDVFAGLGGLAARTPHLNIGYVDLSTVWDGVLGTTPGMEAFGYTAIGPCVSATGGAACASPSTTFYWVGQWVLLCFE